jgi:LPS export ABC transporter protein LptC
MRWTKKKKMIAGLLLVAVFAVFASVMILKNRITPETILKILPDEADFHIKDFVFTEVGKEKEKWEVRAETAEYNKKENLAELTNVHIKLTTAEGKVFEMTGDRGRIQTEAKTGEITGNVGIVSDAGDRFSTQSLRFSDREKTISTDDAITMENRQMKIQAVGLTVNITSGELKLLSGVRAKIN